MTQFANDDVQMAMQHLQDAEQHTPLIHPDQMARITSLNTETDPEVKAAKTVALMDELLQEAAASERKLADLQQQIGLQPGDSERFLAGSAFDAASQRNLQAAAEQFVNETLQTVEGEASQHVGSGHKAALKAPRPSRMRI